MNVRMRRLEADWIAVQKALRNHPKIEIAGVGGNPPQRYQLLYRVKGLVEKPDGTIVEKDEHTAEISLLRGYPREAPACRMLTPVFHPNIAPQAICIGDEWAAGESLVDLIFRIGEIIAFQSYNIKSPLNGVAAKWVEENLARLPLDSTPLAVPGHAVAPLTAGRGKEEPEETVCSKCGRLGSTAEVWRCRSGHTVCSRCRTVCMCCGGPMCPLCDTHHCSLCLQNLCSRCITECPGCRLLVCAAHFDRGRGLCLKCIKDGRRTAPPSPPPSPPKAPALIVFSCSSCRAKLSARPEHAGRKIKCPRCAQECLIPPAGSR